MLRRLPPIALAAIATAVLAAVVVTVVLLTGGAGGRGVPSCSDALEAGPYGCVVFVSIDGSVDGKAVDAAGGGRVTYRVERSGSGERLVWTGDCNGGEGSARITATRYRLGDMLSGQKACEGGAPADAFASRLFASGADLRVDDRDDGTVVVTRGTATARFDQVVAERG